MSDLTELRTPLTEDDWRSLGIDVMQVGRVALTTGTPGWAFDRVECDVPLDTWVAPAPRSGPPAHRAAVTRIDHLVLRVPSLDDADQLLREGLGLDLRRRASPRGAPMGFYRSADAIVEVVEAGGAQGWRLWGVALRTDDMDAAIAVAGDLLRPPNPAIQGGRMASAASDWDGFSVGFYSRV